MADDDFNWDEVLVTTKPDSKEVEVSFKRVDGGGFFQNESGPGTPPGTTEDPDGCRNTATLYSEDVFAFQSNQPHYVWLLLKHPPNEYMEVDIQFSDGDMTYPDYTTQSLTYVIQPGSWENDGNGWYGKKIALLTGDLSAKIDAGTDSGLYYAQITAVRNFGADSCFSPTTVTINFGPAPAEADPPPNEGGGGDPIDPTPDPACEPGIDCDSRYNRTETFEGNYDSVLFLHRPMWYTGAGAPSTFTRAWSADRTDIQQSGLYSDRDANQYQLRDKDDNIIFDGYAESIPPKLEGGASPFRAYINSGGYYTDRDNLCASPTNVGGRYEPNYFTLKEYKMNGTGGDEANCLNQSFTGVDFDSSFRRWSIYNNNKRIVSPWENSAYVPDPTNVPEELKNYNATFSDEHTQWLSVFTPGPWQESAVSSEPYRPITYAHGDPSYPSGPFIYAGGSPHFVHNGIFGGGTFSNPTPLSQGIIYFLGGGSDPYEIQFLYSRGGGGQQSKVSQIKLPAWGKGTGGWVTAKIESWYEIEWKADNTDGDFGLYDFGFVVKQQKFFTWSSRLWASTLKTMRRNALSTSW